MPSLKSSDHVPYLHPQMQKPTQRSQRGGLIHGQLPDERTTGKRRFSELGSVTPAAEEPRRTEEDKLKGSCPSGQGIQQSFAKGVCTARGECRGSMIHVRGKRHRSACDVPSPGPVTATPPHPPPCGPVSTGGGRGSQRHGGLFSLGVPRTPIAAGEGTAGPRGRAPLGGRSFSSF